MVYSLNNEGVLGSLGSFGSIGFGFPKDPTFFLGFLIYDEVFV